MPFSTELERRNFSQTPWEMISRGYSICLKEVQRSSHIFEIINYNCCFGWKTEWCTRRIQEIVDNFQNVDVFLHYWKLTRKDWGKPVNYVMTLENCISNLQRHSMFNRHTGSPLHNLYCDLIYKPFLDAPRLTSINIHNLNQFHSHNLSLIVILGKSILSQQILLQKWLSLWNHK